MRRWKQNPCLLQSGKREATPPLIVPSHSTLYVSRSTAKKIFNTPIEFPRQHSIVRIVLQ